MGMLTVMIEVAHALRGYALRSKLTPTSDILEKERQTRDLLQKALFRCARDLRHCADTLSLGHPQYDLFIERARMWLTVARDPSGYRHELHQVISNLETENDRLAKLLEEHGIQDPRKLPF